MSAIGGDGVGADCSGAAAAGGVPARRSVLVFAGIDPSGGAGIAADLQAIAAQGAHALTVVTALTVQDNDRVYEVQPVAAELVLRQALALVDKVAVSAVKIGIPGNAANARAIAEVIAQLRRSVPELPVVLDPVLASGHGDTLARGDAIAALAPLLPLATLLAPNGPEAAALCRHAASPAAQAQSLLALGCRHVLITGGHGGDGEVVNRWFGAGAVESAGDAPTGESGCRQWHWPRLAGCYHGSGCTLAAAIAALLAQGLSMADALDQAQRYTNDTLRAAYSIAPGQYLPRR
jgi:hydroxymethylpyrimidine/phosphomethylpyrimidine kinase